MVTLTGKWAQAGLSRTAGSPPESDSTGVHRAAWAKGGGRRAREPSDWAFPPDSAFRNCRL